eukprot:GHVS01036660.1.p1 GENE.GHVS01036660.1~~GHVS01036660.1.p1  ORF type:complete len:675 (+),score=72.47 GHVS01036660.1:28-2025(+)
MAKFRTGQRKLLTAIPSFLFMLLVLSLQPTVAEITIKQMGLILERNENIKHYIWAHAKAVWEAETDNTEITRTASEDIKTLIRQRFEKVTFCVWNVKFHATEETEGVSTVLMIDLDAVVVHLIRRRSQTLELAAQYLRNSADVKNVLKEYAEFFWVFNGLLIYHKLELCNVAGAVERLNKLLVKNVAADDSARPSVATPFSWTGDRNDIAKITLVDGHLQKDVDIPLGPRQQKVEDATLSSLRDHYKEVAFPSYANRKNIINLARHLGADKVEEGGDALDEQPISPFSLPNGWFIEVTGFASVVVNKATLEQTGAIAATVKNTEGGPTLGIAEIYVQGPYWQIEPASDDEKGLFDDMQKRIETAAARKWNIATSRAAAAAETWLSAVPVPSLSFEGSVETGFSKVGVSRRFTVTTELEGIEIEGDGVLKYKLSSNVNKWVTFHHTISVKADSNAYVRIVNDFKNKLTSEVKEKWSEQIREIQNSLGNAESVCAATRSCKPVESMFWFDFEHLNVKMTTKLIGAEMSDGDVILKVNSYSEMGVFRGDHLVTIPSLEDFQLTGLLGYQKNLVAVFKSLIYKNVEYLWRNEIYYLTRGLLIGVSIHEHVTTSKPVITVVTPGGSGDEFTVTTEMEGAAMVDYRLRLKVSSKFKSGTLDFQMSHYLTIR